MPLRADIDTTRGDIRKMFRQWGIDPSEYEIEWQEERLANGTVRRLAGATIRYLRNGKWQTVNCYSKWDRASNLRQIFLFLDRVRISEKVGIQYQGLSFTKEVVKTESGSDERDRKESLLDAYDMLGVSPDDPTDLIKDVFRKKSNYYHPDKGGTDEKFKRINEAYHLIMESRGQKP